MIKAIIFDMDGTLIDTTSVGFKLFEDTLKKLKLEYKKEDVYAIANKSFTDVLKELHKRNSKVYDEKIRQELLKEYKESIKDAKMLPHAKELLETVHDKAIMILASMSLEKIIHNIFEKNNLYKYFDMIVGINTKPIKSKKDMIKNILNETKLKPEECILIEDTHHGIKSGMNNGIFTIGVKHFFDDIEADIEVEDLHSAKTIILEKLNEE